jgi:hypothetical protein
MGYLEGTVVVYLRTAVDAGAATPVINPGLFARYDAIEAARELATLVMIGAVGWLAGAGRLERLAWAAVVFGLWDVAYYATLNVAIGWPTSFDDWDILFLVPVAWVGPVWTPVVVSAALVAFGLIAARRLRLGPPVVVGWAHVIGALAGGLLVIASFLVDSSRVMDGDTAPWTGWPIFWAGMAFAIVASVAALRARTGPARTP